LQLLASYLASAALSLLGVPVLREGNIIRLPTMVLEVAEACSGIDVAGCHSHRRRMVCGSPSPAYFCRAVMRKWPRGFLHNRVTATEYWAKRYMVSKSIKVNRSDGAVVRITALPVDSKGMKSTERRAVDFAEQILPLA
jgi:hypothetical protein